MTQPQWDWLIERNKRMKERRDYLNEKYPNKMIKNIDISHLRKIGYAIGLGSTDTKKEYIHKILELQVEDNPIIKLGEEGYYINIRCMLIGYMI